MRSTIGSIALAAAMITAASSVHAFDETKYPDWSGQWRRPPGVGNQWDTSKPPRQGRPPLTPEYQADRAPIRPIPAFPTACRVR